MCFDYVYTPREVRTQMQNDPKEIHIYISTVLIAVIAAIGSWKSFWWSMSVSVLRCCPSRTPAVTPSFILFFVYLLPLPDHLPVCRCSTFLCVDTPQEVSSSVVTLYYLHFNNHSGLLPFTHSLFLCFESIPCLLFPLLPKCLPVLLSSPISSCERRSPPRSAPVFAD